MDSLEKLPVKKGQKANPDSVSNIQKYVGGTAPQSISEEETSSWKNPSKWKLIGILVTLFVMIDSKSVLFNFFYQG